MRREKLKPALKSLVAESEFRTFLKEKDNMKFNEEICSRSKKPETIITYYNLNYNIVS